MIIQFPSNRRRKSGQPQSPPAPSSDHLARPPEKRGLARDMAASYIDVSSSLFDQLVADGRMPRPKTINSRVVWDRWEIDAAFTALPHRDDGGTQSSNDDDEWGTAV
jgi:predicted DNA-binding transcriptional regulator AlpA